MCNENIEIVTLLLGQVAMLLAQLPPELIHMSILTGMERNVKSINLTYSQS